MVKQVNAASEVVGYPGVGHGFHADYRPSSNKAAADDAWKRCVDLFTKHVKA
jgi:carboxymethylenebutenolidase